MNNGTNRAKRQDQPYDSCLIFYMIRNYRMKRKVRETTVHKRKTAIRRGPDGRRIY